MKEDLSKIKNVNDKLVIYQQKFNKILFDMETKLMKLNIRIRN